ncbi:MAG TPA: hypothetical protein VGJ84_13770 [Polyangiaceae bacterium]
MTVLSEGELALRARRLKLVLTDVDGVLTDTGVYYSERGEELKRFSVRDGMGMELLRGAGIETGFLTRENSGVVRARADKLGLRHVFLGVRDKLAHLSEVVARTGIDANAIAFIGDDVNDLALIERISVESLTGAPADAVAPVRALVHCVTPSGGGHGAFRDFADWILALVGPAHRGSPSR